ncbi:MAG: biopolymer transporter ExbD [Candidatus Kryptonium sp.]
MFRRRKRAEAEIPSASMADIAFELMIFFLVATTFDVDTGIGLVLPPAAETTEQVKVKQSDIAKLLVNAAGEVLLDGELITVQQIRELIKNKIKANPKLIVSIKTDRETNYSRYIEVLDELKLAYNDLREEYSLKTFGKSYKDLTRDQQEEVKKEIPIRISIAEPEEVK